MFKEKKIIYYILIVFKWCSSGIYYIKCRMWHKFAMHKLVPEFWYSCIDRAAEKVHANNFSVRPGQCLYVSIIFRLYNIWQRKETCLCFLNLFFTLSLLLFKAKECVNVTFGLFYFNIYQLYVRDWTANRWQRWRGVLRHRCLRMLAASLFT